MYADNLKKLRFELGMSAQKMADSLGVTQMSISNYETGKRKPSFEFMEALYNTYNVNLNWFVSGKGEMFITSQSAPQFNEEQLEAKIEQVFNKLYEQKKLK